MQYAIIENNTIIEYPVDIRTALPNTSMRANWPGGEVDGITYAAVYPSDKPVYNRDTQNIIESAPVKTGSEWFQVWSVVDASPEEIASRLDAKRASLSCSPRQIRLALAGMGVLESIESWITTQPSQARIEWEYATVILRTDPLVVAAALALNMNDIQLDALFEQARQL